MVFNGFHRSGACCLWRLFNDELFQKLRCKGEVSDDFLNEWSISDLTAGGAMPCYIIGIFHSRIASNTTGYNHM